MAPKEIVNRFIGQFSYWKSSTQLVYEIRCEVHLTSGRTTKIRLKINVFDKKGPTSHVKYD